MVVRRDHMGARGVFEGPRLQALPRFTSLVAREYVLTQMTFAVTVAPTTDIELAEFWTICCDSWAKWNLKSRLGGWWGLKRYGLARRWAAVEERHGVFQGLIPLFGSTKYWRSLSADFGACSCLSSRSA